jgi:two-component system cell cycle sensor histidine kinase/response regulator CckA
MVVARKNEPLRGFAVETINEAARRAGIKIDWVPGGTPDANNQSLLHGDIDLILGSATEERRRLFYVTDAWWSSEIIAVVPATSKIRTEDDLRGRILAGAPGTNTAIASLAPAKPGVSMPNAIEAANAACAGAADAAVLASMYLRELLAVPSSPCRALSLRTIDVSSTVDYVLTTRHEDAGIATRLKRHLDDITADGTLTAIAARNPPISTGHAKRLEDALRSRYESTLWRLIGLAISLVGLLAVAFLVRLQRSKKALAEANARLAEDLEARTRAEKALNDSELRFRALLDSAPQTVLAVEPSGAIAFANAKAESMFGYDPDVLVSRPIGSLFAPELQSQNEELWWRHLEVLSETGRSARGEVVALHHSGRRFPAEVTYGELSSGVVILFIQDASQKLALEAQLREAHKLDSIGQLAGGVAHDFNNLLTVIQGYIRLMLNQLHADSSLRGQAEKIAQAATKAAALTGQLLAFSRREAPQARTFILCDLVQNIEGILRPLIRENVQMVITRPLQTGWIHADPSQVEQVLINLVLNARDAMPGGGRLSIDVESVSETVILRVADTGGGIAADVKARIFDPFFTTKPPGKGTGLGLSVVYGIVRQSGASIEVQSEVGTGTTMEIKFPRAAPQTSRQEVSRPALPATEPGHGTILLAEDEPGVRDFVSEILRRNGYEVLAASNGREAMDVLAKAGCPIDLLLTDTIMPEIGGASLGRTFAARFPGTPILRMTGYAEREEDDDPSIPVLKKPFTAPALLSLVREAMDGATPNSRL